MPRLKAAGADLDRVFIFQLGKGSDEVGRLELPRDIDAIGQWALEKGLRFIVLDPAVSYVQRGIDWKDDQAMRAIMDPLAILARKLGAFIAFVRHWIKTAVAKALLQSSGAGTIANASRIGYACIRDADDPELRYLAMVKTNLCAPQPARMYRIKQVGVEGFAAQGNPCTVNTTRVEWVGASAKTADQLHQAITLAPERLAVIKALKDKGVALTPKALATILNKPAATMRQLCRSMLKDKQLRQVGKRGFYWPVGEPLPSND